MCTKVLCNPLFTHSILCIPSPIFCSPHLSSFCPDDGTCIGTETLVIKVFSTSEEFLKQEMDHINITLYTVLAT